MTKEVKILTVALVLIAHVCFLPFGHTAKRLGYDDIRISNNPKVNLVIPQDMETDRFYTQAKFSTQVVNVVAQIDNKRLVKPVGTNQTSSIPPELGENFGHAFTSVAVFPLEPFKSAIYSIKFGFKLSNGKEKQIKLTKKQIKRFKSTIE